MSDYFLKVVKVEDEEYFKKSVELQKKVYCDECGFERRKDFKNNYAFDDYDAFGQTKRALILNKEDVAVATVRLIVPGKLELPANILMPELKTIKKQEMAECSGFCYSQTVSNQLFLSAEVRQKIVLLLIGSLYVLTKEEHINYTAMVIQNRLFNYLEYLGVKLNTVGKEINYHGKRRICWVDTEKDVIEGIQNKSLSNWRIMTRNSSIKSFNK